MYQGSKKITVFGLLLLLAIPLIFTLTVLLKQRALQYHNRERLNTELLQTVIVLKQELNWLKEGKEAVINGKLFDVKSYKTEGNNVLLTGFFDGKEDILVQHINKIVQEKNEKNNPVNQLAVKFLWSPKYNGFNFFSVQNTWQIITRQFLVYSEVINKLSYPAPAPPPKFC